jgi:hypothetical protein
MARPVPGSPGRPHAEATQIVKPLHRCAALLLVAAIVGACVPQVVLPATCNDPSVMLRAALADTRLEPGTLEVCRDQHVTLMVDVKRDGILHLHGYDDQAPAAEVRAGRTLTLEFTAVRSGQFPIALHTTDGPAEVTVGTLIVHER